MNWQSIWAMTVIDLAVVGMITYTLAYFVRMRGRITRPTTRFGLLSVAFGLVVVALLYLADLASMHLLPTVLGERQAMAFMRELHFDYNWFVVLISIGAISLGLMVSGRGLLRVVQDLRDSEERLGDFAEASADYFWQTDAQLRYSYLSPQSQQSFDRSIESLIGQYVQDATAPAFQKQESWQYIDRQMQLRQPFRDVIIERQGAKSGESVWIRISGKPFYDDSGEFQGFRGSSTNITENRRADEALRETERQFRVLAANVAGGLLYMDTEARYVFVNTVYANWFGLEPEDFIGHTARDVLGQDVDDEVREYFRASLGGEKVTYEAVRQTTVSGPRDVQVTNVPNIAADGTVEGVFALVTDVSELRRRERALEESQRNLAEAQRIGRIGHWRVEADSEEAVWSTEMYRIWDRDSTGAPMTFDDILDAIHPDDRLDVITARNTAIAENQPYGLDFRIVRSNGEIRYVRNEGRPEFDAEGRLVSVFGISQDITEYKQAEVAMRDSEQNFRAIAEGSPVPLMITRRADGAFLYANPKVGPVLGIPTEAIEGRKIGEFYWSPNERDMRVERLEAEGFISDDPLELRRADGTHISTIISMQNITYAGEEAILSSFQDVTERLYLEEQLRQAQKMEAIGQLTGGVAHDFNNLLAVIMGNLELLLEKSEPDSSLNSFAMRALAATQRGADLTHRLLAFSRRQPLQPVSVDINKLARGMQDLLVRSLGETIEIEMVGGAGLWQCEVDPGQLENAILNLALNARDAMPQGGRLTIETSNSRLDDGYAVAQDDVEPGQYVLLAISDTGTGMAPEVIEHAFDPFFTTKEVGKGSGLGLSMIYGFVKQSGGHARIYSELGEGTTMKIYLPRSAAGTQPEISTQAVTDTAARGEVIMVAEDDAEVRRVAISILDDLGYEVLEADTADVALAQMELDQRVALLVTDVILPGGMGGPELAEKAGDFLPSLKVLYMSGYTENAIMHHGRLYEGVQLLVKPFGRTDLAVKVRSILDDAL